MFSQQLSATVVLVLIILNDQTSSAVWLSSENIVSAMDEAHADFALDLLRGVAGSDESAIISPFSIAVALAMTSVGAEGETKKQMINVLAKGQEAQQFDNYINAVLSEAENKAKGYTLDIANRLYLGKNLTLKEAYLKIIESHFAGQLRQVDFKQTDAVVQEINSWVKQQTHDKITNLVTSDNINLDTRLMLVNAVYFKGKWEIQFKEELTKRKPFHIAANKQKEVEMMSIKAHFPYYEDEDVQVLGMPYTGGEVHMFIILPRQQFGLADVEKKLTGKQLLAYIQQCDDAEVQVQVPKFKMEKKLELVKALKKLGMTDAFDENKADFKGISDESLYISDVIHKAFIEVNEEGTEAAAASSIGMRLRSAPNMLPFPKSFHADHPYLFSVVWQSRIVLFSGRVA